MTVAPHLVERLVLDHLQEEGIDAPLRSFVDHCVDMLDCYKLHTALGNVDRAYYDDFLRDEAINAQVERRAA
jgi:hypothetical protein